MPASGGDTQEATSAAAMLGEGGRRSTADVEADFRSGARWVEELLSTVSENAEVTSADEDCIFFGCWEL